MRARFVCGLLLLVGLSSMSYGEQAYTYSATKESAPSATTTISTASLWGLTEAEMTRYQEIISGPLGKWNNHIDPVMALGIYAKSDADRRRYAELYAMQEFQLTAMTQRFQREYDHAFKELFPQEKLIDPALLASYYTKNPQKDVSASQDVYSAFQAGDKLLYFADMHCQACRRPLKALESLIVHERKRFKGVSVDVYVVNAKTEEDVRQWAVDHHIARDLVKHARITLNIDNGLQKQLNAASQQASDIYLLRNNTTFAINPEHIGLSL